MLNDDIDKFIGSDTVSDIDKQNRLYVEVRYRKATCLSMNSTTLNNFFKLRHKGKKLEYKSHAECLMKYLDTSRSINLVTIPDLQNTLGQIQNSLFEEVDNNNNNNNNSHVTYRLQNT